MKRLKRVTKREKKAMLKFINEMKQNQPTPDVVVKSKTPKTKVVITLTKFLENQAKKKLAKANHRADKRAAKEEAKGKKKHDHKHDHDHEHEHEHK
jgi:ABC-type Zn2+ transport system substrate-binding protein/surface adhesin